MQFLFRKKAKLHELIPQGAVDIHNHLLPGIDDGSKDVDASRKIMEGMRKMGFDKFISTPHTMTGVWDNTPDTISESFNELYPGKELNALPHRFASEYLLDIAFEERIDSELLTIKDKMVLVELSFLQPPHNLYELLFALQLKGYTPILAHPERYSYYFRDMKDYEKLKNAGCYFQLNLMSVVGHYGPDEMKIADKLLKSGMIDFTGTDIHHHGHLGVFDRPLRIKNRQELEAALERTTSLW